MLITNLYVPLIALILVSHIKTSSQCNQKKIPHSRITLPNAAVKTKLFPSPGPPSRNIPTLEETLAATSILRKKQLGQVDGVLKLGAKIPKIGVVFAALSGAVSFLQGYIKTPDPFHGSFWENVTSISERTTFVQKLSDIHAHLTAFNRTAQRISDERFTVAQKAPEASVGFNELEKVYQFYSERSSILRKFPLYSSPTLLAQTPIFLSYLPFAANINPILYTRSKSLLCDLKDILQLYKKEVIKSRYKEVQVKEWKFNNGGKGCKLTDKACAAYINDVDISIERDLIFSLPYNPDGYRKSTDQIVGHCYQSYDNCSQAEDYNWKNYRGEWPDTYADTTNCIVDPVLGYIIGLGQPRHCVMGIFEESRHWYEETFDLVINSIEVNETECEMIRKKIDPLSNTGEVEVTIHLVKALGAYGFFSGWYKILVETYLNGELLGKTEAKKAGREDPRWTESYTRSQVKKNEVELKFKVMFASGEGLGEWSGDLSNVFRGRRHERKSYHKSSDGEEFVQREVWMDNIPPWNHNVFLLFSTKWTPQ